MNLIYPYGFTQEELNEEASRCNFHPAIKLALRWLVDDGHLTGAPKSINNNFASVAITCAVDAPDSPQTTLAIHKLIEAKDCAIRGYIESSELRG